MTETFHRDRQKDLSNRVKHKVSFDEAVTVFYDERARLISDPDHSIDEDRFILLGVSHAMRLLVVIHAYNENDAIIRIVSARKAAKNETKIYEGGNK